MSTYQETLHNLCSLRTTLHDLYVYTEIKEYFLLYKEVVNDTNEMRKCPQLAREQLNPAFSRKYKIQEHRMHIISYENHIEF